MTEQNTILAVGYSKGEIDFGIRATISDLTYEQMNQFRAMCMVAIGVAEDMWRRSREQQGDARTTNNTTPTNV